MRDDWELRHWKAQLPAAWAEYRSATGLPMAKAYARRRVSWLIEKVRAAAGRMNSNAYRRPVWWNYMPEDAA